MATQKTMVKSGQLIGIAVKILVLHIEIGYESKAWKCNLKQDIENPE